MCARRGIDPSNLRAAANQEYDDEYNEDDEYEDDEYDEDDDFEEEEQEDDEEDEQPEDESVLLGKIKDRIAVIHQPKSPLDRLPPDQQLLLYQLLRQYSLRTVQTAILEPPPNGLGLSASHTALSDFLHRYPLRRQADQQRDAEQIAQNTLADPNASVANLAHASERLLNIRLLQTANNPNAAIRDLRDLFQTHTRLRALDLAAQRLAAKT